MKTLFLIYAVLCLCANLRAHADNSLNILAIIAYEGKSHFFVFEPFLRELAGRGHNVTVISHFPLKQPLENYHDISLAGTVKILESHFPVEKSYLTVLHMSTFLFGKGTDNCKILLGNRNVQQLWQSKPKFDVVLYEMFNSDCALGLAHQLEAPVVAITSHVILPWHYNRFGISYNPSYVPLIFLEGGFQPTLYQRIERSIFHYYFKLSYKYFEQAVDQKTLAKYFDNVPPLEDLAKNIKFLLVYHNFILTGSRLFPANVIEVGGYHVSKPKPLSTDLLKFIDEAEHGVIYICLGSMLKANSMPLDKVDAILGALKKIPQRIIWKWDNKTLPGNPKNIFTSDWLPQNDILAHPNVIVFYSHAGLLSTTEAIHYGVPMIAMPIFGDQPSNAAAIEDSGLGVQLQIGDLTEDNLLATIKKVTDFKFREHVKQLSKMWHDRPLSPMDSAVYWTEFAARHSNFTFRTKSADVPLYQYICLDVIILVLLILIGLCFAITSILNFCFCRKSIKSQSTKKKSKKE